MVSDLIKDLKTKLDKTIDYFKNELSALQVGRATPSLVENIEVEAYGRRMALKELAAISAPEPRLLLVRPWDREIMTNIEAAIRQSSLRLSPMTEEDLIRLMIPALNEERRKELNSILQQKAEECRISIRRQREDVWKQIQEMERKKEIPQDDKFRGKDELQKVVDDYNDKIEGLRGKKEKEIMEV